MCIRDRKEAAPRFRRVLNATGVVIHTNMGRSVLADEAVNAILKACRGYSNLELNLATGERGSRYSHVEELLCTLTGTEAALVVNNNAAAVLITMDAVSYTHLAHIEGAIGAEAETAFRRIDLERRDANVYEGPVDGIPADPVQRRFEFTVAGVHEMDAIPERSQTDTRKLKGLRLSLIHI